MLSRLVITFPRSKRLLISWLQLPSTVILEPRKIKSATVFTVSPFICHEVMGQMSWSLFSEYWALSQLHSICQQIRQTRQLPKDWKRSVFILVPKKDIDKECSNYCTIALISHASKKCSKLSKLGFNSMWTKNFQMFKLDLEKAEEPKTKLPSPVGSQKKQESSRKTSTSALLSTPKPLAAWVKTNWRKSLKVGE